MCVVSSITWKSFKIAHGAVIKKQFLENPIRIKKKRTSKAIFTIFQKSILFLEKPTAQETKWTLTAIFKSF